MKVRRSYSRQSMRLAGRVRGDLHADLTGYAEYDREILGECIALWPLVVQMLGTFVDAGASVPRVVSARRVPSGIPESGRGRGHGSLTAR